jgi:hypothetical protein
MQDVFLPGKNSGSRRGGRAATELNFFFHRRKIFQLKKVRRKKKAIILEGSKQFFESSKNPVRGDTGMGLMGRNRIMR